MFFNQRASFFQYFQDIIGMNLLTKFHEDWTINVASRVKNAPPLDSHVFQAKVTIFKLIQDIIGTHFLTKFNEDQKINILQKPYKEKCPTPGDHVFQPTGIIFELFQDIIGINLLTNFHEEEKCPAPWQPCFSSKFHEDLKKNVDSRVLTRKNAPPPGSSQIQTRQIFTGQ
ncbi:hypothetical protein DPMN_018806 [Dreissena polymorpha]|uniref:Uncharacterized protein n=1 Tax=Dreissena polymorpha TaxID=45954 RepID=A0A9D4NJH5_DREPO|nr:hypothetical protein DPMN_018806 [Dreissena polymorpha]